KQEFYATTTTTTPVTTTTTKSVDPLTAALAEAEKKVRESSQELEAKAKAEASRSPADIVKELQQYTSQRPPSPTPSLAGRRGGEVEATLPKFDHVPNWRDLLGPSFHSNFGEAPVDDEEHIRVKALDEDVIAGGADMGGSDLSSPSGQF
ncbi:hypothetical protein FOZ62_013832, partial [Perkinsus olseni]